jgi:hypothetical protein
MMVQGQFRHIKQTDEEKLKNEMARDEVNEK